MSRSPHKALKVGLIPTISTRGGCLSCIDMRTRLPCLNRYRLSKLYRHVNEATLPQPFLFIAGGRYSISLVS
jgi:hypothetical protein